MTTQLVGTGRLLRLALRRDRVRLTVWLVVLIALVAGSAQAVVGLYPTEADRVELARTSAASAAAVALNGLVSGTSLGAVTSSQLLLISATAAAIMSVLLVVRHTRAEEEAGRSELVGATVVGRHATLAAAVLVGVGANAVLALVSTAALVALGLPLDGSLALMLAVALCGTAFLGIAAVTAQVAESARGANGLGLAAIGIAFLLRAAGDATGAVVEAGTRIVPTPLSWLSPIGWAEAIRPYDDNAWWTLGLLAPLATGGVVVAYLLRERRDLGSGLRAARPGPAAASRWLSGPLGLAWRLQRGTLLAWAVAVAVVGLAYGSIGTQAEEMLEQGAVADYVDQLGGGGADLTEAYFAAVLALMAVAASAYAVQTVLRMRAEELSGRLEPVLASAVARSRWMLSHIGIAMGGATLLLVLCGATTGLAFGLGGSAPGEQTARLAAAALAYAPAALVVPAATVAAVGLLPRAATAIGWGVLSACLLLGQVGILLDLPQALLDLSPFVHSPPAPVADVTALPLVLLGAAAVALTAAGMAAFRRRDLTT